MEDLFGEKKLLLPCIGVSAILVSLMVIIVIGGAF